MRVNAEVRLKKERCSDKVYFDKMLKKFTNEMNKTFIITLMLVLSSLVVSCSADNSKTVDSFIKMGKQVIAKGSPAWQVKIYQKYINHPELLKIQWALVTSYNGNESCGRVDGSGKRCTTRVAASNVVSRGRYVWTKYGLRQVLDSGAHSNDSKARGRGCAFWMDYWYPTGNNPIDGWNKTPVIVLK